MLMIFNTPFLTVDSQTYVHIEVNDDVNDVQGLGTPPFSISSIDVVSVIFDYDNKTGNITVEMTFAEPPMTHENIPQNYLLIHQLVANLNIETTLGNDVGTLNLIYIAQSATNYYYVANFMRGSEDIYLYVELNITGNSLIFTIPYTITYGILSVQSLNLMVQASSTIVIGESYIDEVVWGEAIQTTEYTTYESPIPQINLKINPLPTYLTISSPDQNITITGNISSGILMEVKANVFIGSIETPASFITIEGTILSDTEFEIVIRPQNLQQFWGQNIVIIVQIHVKATINGVIVEKEGVTQAVLYLGLGTPTSTISTATTTTTYTPSENPMIEAPTDASIRIDFKIMQSNIKSTEIGGQLWIDFIIEIVGTTNGVHHVGVGALSYYIDGTYDFSGWLNAYGNYIGDPSQGYKIAQSLGSIHINITLVPTSSNWTTFYGKLKFQGPGGEIAPIVYTKELDKIFIIVRAFADSSERRWNQVYKQVPLDISMFTTTTPQVTPEFTLSTTEQQQTTTTLPSPEGGFPTVILMAGIGMAVVAVILVVIIVSKRK
jgi:hypothetical protein